MRTFERLDASPADETVMSIQAASESVFGEVERLLGAVSLPIGGLRDQFPAGYVIANDAGSVVGCAGLEIYGSAALLRSVAVRASYRKAGLGHALVANRVDAARARRLDAIYLLTTTAAGYFSRLGFASVDRARAPAEVASCSEFACLCPASATCFMLTL